MGKSAGLRNPESQGEHQKKNCEDAQVLDIGSVSGKLNQGTGGEPGARTSRLGRQAGSAEGQAPPSGRDVPREPTQRAEHLNGRKGTPEGCRRGSSCQTLEEKRLDHATGILELWLAHGEGMEGSEVLAVGGKGGLRPGPGDGTVPSESSTGAPLSDEGIQQGKVGRPAR